MSQAFGWGAPTRANGVLGTGHRLLYGQPAQHQAELRSSVAKLNVVADRAYLEFQVGESDHRIARLLQKTAGQTDDIPGQQQIDDLPLAIAQKLVARSKTALDNAKLAILVAVDDEVPLLIDDELGFEQLPQTCQVVIAQHKIAVEPHYERVSPCLTWEGAKSRHLASGTARIDSKQ